MLYVPVVAERGSRKAVVVCGHEMSSVDALVETGIPQLTLVESKTLVGCIVLGNEALVLE
jgi:hypothetical protein